MHDLNSMASSITATSAPFAGSNAWRPAESSSMGLRISMEEHQGFNKTASLQSMPQNGPIYSGSHYHDIAEKHNGVMQEEDSVPKPPPTKVRRKHGTAMDPQSIAARTRRERFSDRIRTLQRLVPNAERLDTVSMLGQTLEYVRFLQHQVSELYHGKDPAAPSNVCEKWKDFMEAECASANQGGSI
ncbi:hypothetical protein KP509_07G083400 [Ceratopteris richardii]|nr:hypothetical protein KP509_07G083400 [Ceratopteris richardii]